MVHNRLAHLLDLSTIQSCTELTVEHAKHAATSSDAMRKLLKRVAEVARPGEGAPKLLMAIARLVGQDWVEGELRVELAGDDATTTLIVMADFGVGIRERMFPMVRLSVPIDEFHRALELAPQLVLPLKITDETGKIVLTPLLTPEERNRDEQTVDYVLDQKSLTEDARTTAPPPPGELQVIDEAMPSLDPVGFAGLDDLAEPASGRSVHEAPTKPPAALPADMDHGVSGEHSLEPSLDEVLASARMESGPVPTERKPPSDRSPTVHTRPTVRRMVAIDVAAIAAAKRRDPRRDDD
ncbi:MAG: hypothetical protein JWP97_2247 [Labilithrix sp.]|nr:hypothetical protein [Labilithrix sp.]